MKKIAIVTPGTFTLPSTRCSSVEHIVQETASRLSNRFSFRIYCKKEISQSVMERISGITYIRPPAVARTAYWRKTIQSLRHHPPDAIQVENRPVQISSIRKSFPSIPLLLQLHSIRFLAALPIHKRSPLEKCDRIIVNSVFLKRYVEERFPRVASKIRVNYPGVNPSSYQPGWSEQGRELAQQMKRRLGYEDKKIVLFAGRMIEQKGIHHLLQAVPDVVNKHPQCVFIIVGSPFYGKDLITPYVASLHQMGNRYPQHVRFIPYIPQDHMRYWYGIADIVVVPSVRDEAFGLVNVEAMASGVPIVASTAGGIGEIVTDGENGLLFSGTTDQQRAGAIAERIDTLLSDDLLRMRLGTAGRSKVIRQLTWSHTAERMAMIYRELGI